MDILRKIIWILVSDLDRFKCILNFEYSLVFFWMKSVVLFLKFWWRLWSMMISCCYNEVFSKIICFFDEIEKDNVDKILIRIRGNI